MWDPFAVTTGASGYWWYRRRYLLNRPETLSERYAPSESGLGAGEDIFRVGYVHSPELPRVYLLFIPVVGSFSSLSLYHYRVKTI